MGQVLGIVIIKSVWWKWWFSSNVQQMVLEDKCQRQRETRVGEPTLIVLDKMMTLLVQRLNELIMLRLVA